MNRVQVWRFRYALWRLRRSLPESWTRLSEDEQEVEIRELVRQVRAERRIRLENSASFSETEVTLP